MKPYNNILLFKAGIIQMESHKLSFKSSIIKFMKNATTSKIQLLEQNKKWSVKQKHNFL